MAAKLATIPEFERLSLTSWLDAILGFFADQAKISKEDYVSQTGGEWLASGVEFVCDMFTKGILNKAIHTILGGAAGTYAIWGSPPNKRLQKELIAMSNHALTRILDPRSSVCDTKRRYERCCRRFVTLSGGIERGVVSFRDASCTGTWCS